MKKHFNGRLKKFAVFLCTTSVISSSTVFAQNTQSTVIVSGSRFEENLNEVPADVKVISRDQIENSTSNNIPEVLSQIGGLSVRTTSGGNPLNLDASVDMGGYGATANSTTLILVDGQRLNPIDGGTVNWQSIPIDSIERIEILQGGASVQYGNGAVGGVINIITNGGAKNLNQASITYGSYNTVISNAILRNKFKDTTVQLSANTSNTTGWRPNSAANAYSFDGKIIQSLGGIDQIYVDLFFNHTNSGLPGPVLGQANYGNPKSLRPIDVGATSTRDNSGLRAGFIKAINDKLTFDLDGSYSNTNTNFNTPFFGSTAYSLLPSWQFSIAPKIKADLGNWGKTIIGYDFNKSSQSNSSGPNFSNTTLGQDVNLMNQSIFLITRIPLPIIDRLEISGGFRHQAQNASANNYSSLGSASASQKYSANAGTVAFNYNYQPGQKIYIKWDQSFRFPNTNEFWGFNPFTYAPVFNGILKPQTSQTYSIGGEWNLNKVRFSTSVFQSITENEIRLDPATFENINTAGNVTRTGFLFDSSTSINQKLTVAGGGKYQKSTFSSGPIAGVGFPLAPDVLLNARVQYAFNNAWGAGAIANYVGSQNYDASPALINSLSKMPSYLVADVYLNYNVNSWDTRFTIKNIGGGSYSTAGGYSSSAGYYYYPSTPTTYFVTAKYSFK